MRQTRDGDCIMNVMIVMDCDEGAKVRWQLVAVAQKDLSQPRCSAVLGAVR